LLVLDEPTANLDSKAEAEIWKSLESIKGTLTVIVISHKPVPKRLYDAVLNLTRNQ
jgi:ABC-type bacteriocin/lantibiotic exporter with double-glycine peptidase domain